MGNMKLDTTDKKIIAALLNNSRASYTQLAKKTKLSREIITYRTKKLEKNVIRAYITKLRQSPFGHVATLFLTLKKNNTENYKKTIKEIIKHSHVNWAATLCGTHDLVLTFLYKNPTELGNITDKILGRAGTLLKNHELLLYIQEYKFDRTGLLTKEQQKTKHYKEPKLDKQDTTILKELSNNSRISNTALANKTGLSDDSIRNRIKKLELSIITGYTIALNTTALGYDTYYVSIELERVNENIMKKIKHYSNITPEIIFCARTSGTHNIILQLAAKNRYHFNILLSKLRKTFDNEIQNYEFQILLEELKEIFVPEALIIKQIQ